jgi:hypothetical protein
MPETPETTKPESAGTVYRTRDGVDITRLVRLHRRYHANATILCYMAMLASMRSPRRAIFSRKDMDDKLEAQAASAFERKVARKIIDRSPYKGPEDNDKVSGIPAKPPKHV